MLDQGDAGAFGWSAGPSGAQKVGLEIGMEPAAQMECQRAVQQGAGWARAHGCAFFFQALVPKARLGL